LDNFIFYATTATSNQGEVGNGECNSKSSQPRDVETALITPAAKDAQLGAAVY
jgi:hypothetical protein